MTVKVSVHPRHASVGVAIIGRNMAGAAAGLSPRATVGLAGRLLAAAAHAACRRR